MEAFIDFFEHMSNGTKFAWILICLIFSWGLEGFAPLVRFKYNKVKHDSRNLIFLGTSMLINILIGITTVGVYVWVDQNNFGFLNAVDWSPWVELLIAVMFLDLVAQYVAHYLLHRIKWMWKFHMVHHSDTKVDATTGTRHHPGDYLIREVFSLIAVILSGMPLGFYLFYRIATIFFAYFTHANFYMPTWLDKALSWVIITPNMHKFHHHYERPWTDTNFGNIFSFWDRIFGTFVYDDPRKVKYGLDVLQGKDDEDVLYQFKLPFDKTVKTDY
ncbi:MAG: sterol desaturase family protein [Bacteroidetes bacterium]|nr:MAG: sterol desaturase family protein [Bacteroidota bacterium]